MFPVLPPLVVQSGLVRSRGSQPLELVRLGRRQVVLRKELMRTETKQLRLLDLRMMTK